MEFLLTASLLYAIQVIICSATTDCTVDTNDNIMSGTQLCGNLVGESDAEYANISQNQFAASSFPELVSPTLLFLADPSSACSSDIATVLSYATQCNYSVAIKSGGHQYSGLSSCADQCIQIDLQNYNETQMSIDAEFSDYTNVIKVGAGTDLLELNLFLDSNGLFLPTGLCSSVGVGGHFQTGGIGYLLRSHGAFTDAVIGFDIVLADGEQVLVTKDNNYKNLFYSVRGGGPGSFGVVTNVYLSAFSNTDYPSNAVAVRAYWEYTHEDALAVTKTWAAIHRDANYTDYDDWYPLFSIGPSVQNDTIEHIIFLEFIWIPDVNGRGYYEFGKPYFTQRFLDNAVNPPVLFSETNGTISELMLDFVIPTTHTSPFPYVARANLVSQPWDEAFVDILIDNVTSLMEYSNQNGNVFMNLIVESYGGMFLKNDPTKSLSALLYRDLSMMLMVQLLYTDETAKTYSADYLQDTFTQYIASDAWQNEDIRFFAGTFGELDMDIERENLNYYRNASVLDGLMQVKGEVDADNIFRNRFTVPLPDDDDDDGDDPDSTKCVGIFCVYVAQFILVMYAMH